jgi:hypothetical protein
MTDASVYVTACNGNLVGTADRTEDAYQLVDQHIDSHNAAGRPLPTFYVLYWRDQFGLAHQKIVHSESRERSRR